MKSFLEHVAKDIINKWGTNLSNTAIVFPNKRASLFLNDHLAHLTGKPLWSPAYITISDLFRSHSDLTIGDNIKLVCDLHKCFIECTKLTETLDHFYGWGQLLLADFDDIDKNLAAADKVFANLRDIHELDDVSYLSPFQIEIIKKFFSNFSEDHNSELKNRFLSLWSHFYDIYVSFNQLLTKEGLAYEGALYRRVAIDETTDFKYDRYIFIGFNVLHKVERLLFKRLKEEGKAFFYWDFDQYYMSADKVVRNEAGHYISTYLSFFPNELEQSDDAYNNFSSAKDIAYISAPTETIQARYISKWLQERNRIADGKKTAIVLCNEKLLKTVVHCLPDTLDKVNITTGYPLSQSPLSSMVSLLIALQTTGYVPSKDKYRLYSVNAILRHPYISYITDASNDLLKQLNEDNKVYYPDRTILSVDSGTTLLFDNIACGRENMPFTGQLVSWILNLLKITAKNARNVDSDPLFNESLFQMYTIMNRLAGLIAADDLNVDVITLQRLILQIIQSTNIPFHGEPAVGVQIMGVLETRNLDFEHILILSCNEGNMPKGIHDTSFIPYSIRNAYELTTIDNKVAIYSYYFHRMLQRANDITIMYNNSTNNGTASEMSRFMLQIMIESGHVINQKTLQAGQTPTIQRPQAKNKTEKVMQRLTDKFDISLRTNDTKAPLLTPTAINKYARCQLQFYYRYVANIKELVDNDDDSIDNRLFGNIFHTAAQKLYEFIMQRGTLVVASDLKRMLHNKVDIERVVDVAFDEELFKTAESSRHPEYSGLQLINREVIITYLQRLIEIDLQQAPFHIVGLEKDVTQKFDIDTGKVSFQTLIGGRVDRIDCINDGDGERLRVIDYKTGGRKIKSLPDIASVFDPQKLSDHNDYYLQAMLYSMIVNNSYELNRERRRVSPALLFIQHTAGSDYDPVLCFGKNSITDIAKYSMDFQNSLRHLINEMFNPDIPFTPTSNNSICKTCPYKQLCGI